MNLHLPVQGLAVLQDNLVSAQDLANLSMPSTSSSSRPRLTTVPPSTAGGHHARRSSAVNKVPLALNSVVGGIQGVLSPNAAGGKPSTRLNSKNSSSDLTNVTQEAMTSKSARTGKANLERSDLAGNWRTRPLSLDLTNSQERLVNELDKDKLQSVEEDAHSVPNRWEEDDDNYRILQKEEQAEASSGKVFNEESNSLQNLPSLFSDIDPLLTKSRVSSYAMQPSSSSQSATTSSSLNGIPSTSLPLPPAPTTKDLNGIGLPSNSFTNHNTAAHSIQSAFLLDRQAQVQKTSGLPPPGLASLQYQQRAEDVLWHYMDPSRTVQGPFSASQMQDWFRNHYFTGDLLVKPTYANQFETLDSWISKISPYQQDRPFLSFPAQSQLHSLTRSTSGSKTTEFDSSSSPAKGRSVVGQAPFQSQLPNLSQFTSSYDPFGAKQSQLATPSQSIISSTPSSAMARSSSQDRMQLSQAPTPANQMITQRDPWGAPIQPIPSAHFQSHSALHGSSQLSEDHFKNGLQSRIDTLAEPFSQVHSANLAKAIEKPTSPWQTLPKVFDEQTSEAVSVHASLTPIGKRKPSGLVESAGSLLASLKLEPDTIPKNDSQALMHEVPDRATNTSPSLKTPPIVSAPSPMQMENTGKVDKEAESIPMKSANSSAKKEASKKSGKHDSIIQVTPNKVVVIPAGTPNPKKLPSVASETLPDQSSKQAEEAPESSATSPAAGKHKMPAPWASIKENSSTSASLPSSTSQPSLRDIQAREAKEEQLRKAAEKKVKAAALAYEQASLAARVAQEAESTMVAAANNWTKANGANNTTAAVAAWQQPSASKKTLKEIQEEEVKQAQRKALSQKQAQIGNPSSASLAAAGRGYAAKISGSTPTSAAASASAGPWSTVGSGGKSTISRSPVPSLPVAAAQRSVSTPSKPTPISVNVRPAPMKRSLTNDGAIDKVPQPSAEFLKWCRSALQGLTINVDDFIQMLLQFPINAEASTLEIISDAVYANSPTLDGRRFAETFALKRKADAGLVIKGKQPTVPAAQPIVVKSAADVVRAAPKKEETLNFRVVQAKKKR